MSLALIMACQSSCTQDADYSSESVLDSLDSSKKWGCIVPTVSNHSAMDLVDSMTMVGRDSRKAKLIFSDPKISSVHCAIERRIDPDNKDHPDTIVVHDHSTNGTFLFSNDSKQLEKIGKSQCRVVSSGAEVVLIPKAPNREKVSFVIYFQPSQPTLQKQTANAKYDVRDQLGSGAFATVHLCIDRTTGQKYACKIVDKNKFKLHGSSRPDSLKDEVNILLSLKHENIVQIYECFETDSHLYIILELVSGGELFDRIIAVGRFPEAEALQLFRQIYSAVSYIHALNIIHRDLKPENILLSSKYGLGVKLSDFGLSRVVSSINQAKTMCGTMQYLAPEVIEQKYSYGASVDVWSLGVNLYILLCGYPPFDDSEDCKVPMYTQMMSSSFTFPDDPWKSVSAEAKDLIKRLLTPDFRTRITTPEIGEHPWMKSSNISVNSSLSSVSMRVSLPSNTLESVPEFAEPRAPNSKKRK